ncbi:hypothetical protein [Natronococcus wangiae]|uniref:hypothetical protein n=1 Tax=Natronococcus wangiae TaxID=3068275 RepID=UPI00273F77D3|nr:hypothetical protein [Natronococcus sp. AD5]
MQFRTLAVVAVALLVALSGCAALDGVMTDDQSNGTDDGTELKGADDETNESSDDEANENNDDESEAEDDTDEETTESDDEDGTAEAEWEPPKEPNRPMEDEREDRIESVEFVDKEPAEDGEGYSNFNLEVVANTSMENIDPPEHGDVVGEPYFFVKINEGADNQKIVERTDQVDMDENGTFHIDVRPAGIEEFGERLLTVEVFLMDEDKDWDDIYDAVATQIHFNPGTEADGDAGDDTNGTDDESESNE